MINLFKGKKQRYPETTLCVFRRYSDGKYFNGSFFIKWSKNPKNACAFEKPKLKYVIDFHMEEEGDYIPYTSLFTSKGHISDKYKYKRNW